jgi:hypothetical protein
VNAKLKTNSTVTFTDIDFDRTGWDVKGNVTDGSTKPGEWKAVRLMKGDLAKELRLLMTCVKEPVRDVDKRPDGGDLSITLEKSAKEEIVTPTVDYANDSPPPP